MSAFGLRAARWAAVVLLGLTLAISPILGLLTPYLTGLIAIAVTAATALQGQLFAAYRDYPARVLMLAFGLLALLFTASAETPADVLLVFNFSMFVLYGPVALLLSWFAASGNARKVATLATLGVIAGFAMLAWQAMSFPGQRAVGFNIGPIVLSNALLALGFIGMGGMLVVPSRGAILYAAAPLLAIVATLLTGSRGPMLAVPVLALFSLGFLSGTRFRGSRSYGIAALVVLVVAGGAAVLLLGTRSASVIKIATQLLGGGEVTDTTTRIRLILYEAGWNAFLQQPWIGHGWADIMTAIKPFLAPEDMVHAELPQLHNDLLNFAVTGGIGGIAAYFAIISAPMIGALRSPRDSLRQFRIYGTSVLTITYVVAGLTDLMFGFEFHTAMFVMFTAILLAYCREAPGQTPTRAAAAAAR